MTFSRRNSTKKIRSARKFEKPPDSELSVLQDYESMITGVVDKVMDIKAN